MGLIILILIIGSSILMYRNYLRASREKYITQSIPNFIATFYNIELFTPCIAIDKINNKMLIFYDKEKYFLLNSDDIIDIEFEGKSITSTTGHSKNTLGTTLGLNPFNSRKYNSTSTQTNVSGDIFVYTNNIENSTHKIHFNNYELSKEWFGKLKIFKK